MSSQPFDHLDRSPAESDPELSDVLTLLNKLGAAERADAHANLESRVAQASAPELGAALEPIAIVRTRTAFPMRIAAAVAIGGLSLATWIAGTLLSQPSAIVADNGKTTTTDPTPATTTPTTLASAQTASDWAAVSSLFEDTLGNDIDILSAEVSRLGSSLSDPAQTSPNVSNDAGGAL